jgi:hypothetical protein
MHPFRALTKHYPPGELPPPIIIDELTSQILAFAFRPFAGKEPAVDGSQGWKHSWSDTRKKLFESALAQSKFGHECLDRKSQNPDRAARPGLKRVDSMDFLDQPNDERTGTQGRAMRLSTSLQNSAKQEVVKKNRSASRKSTLSASAFDAS